MIMQTIVHIPGIHCAACEKLIRSISGEYASVSGLTVDFKTKAVTIEHDETFELAKWAEEVASLGEQYAVVS
jgi:copper chaperone CopZ